MLKESEAESIHSPSTRETELGTFLELTGWSAPVIINLGSVKAPVSAEHQTTDIELWPPYMHTPITICIGAHILTHTLQINIHRITSNVSLLLLKHIYFVCTHVCLCVCKYMCLCADQRTTLGVILQVLSTLKKKKKDLILLILLLAWILARRSNWLSESSRDVPASALLVPGLYTYYHTWLCECACIF